MALTGARVTIEGTRPLFWNHFGPEALALGKKARTGVAGNDPQEWRKTVLATPQGQLYLEPSYVFGCLRDGAKFTRRGHGTLQPLLASTLVVEEKVVLTDRCLPKRDLAELLGAENEPVYLDVRAVRNPATRGMNLRYRVAASERWKAVFTIHWDNTVVSEDEMRAVLRDSGQFVGLGDARRIGFGRFRVCSFETLEDGGAQAQTANRALAENSPEGLGAGRKKVRSLRESRPLEQMPHRPRSKRKVRDKSLLKPPDAVPPLSRT